MPLPLADAVFLALLLVLLPAFAMLQAVHLGENIPPRLGMYLSSGASILVMAALSLVLGWGTPGLAAMGLQGAGMVWILGFAGILTAVALALLLSVRALERTMGWGETRILLELLPRTAREKGVFGGLSFIAGFGEEIAYRGFALAWAVQLLGSPSAAIGLTSLAFGLLHAYQGVVGVVRTGLLGALYAASVVGTGNLWPAILSHIAVDLLAGLVLADTLTGAADGHRSGSAG
jgi:membrane protease YdiL (CAAX protease family)